jgi:hypothetical protein
MKKNYIFNIIFMIFSIPIWPATSNPMGSLNLTIPLMTYSSIYLIEQLEDLYKYDCIINSLPVTRDEIVKAKFKSIIVIYLINTVLTLITHLIYSLLGVTEFMSGQMLVMGLALSFLISMIFAAVGIVLIYKYGYAKTKLFGIAIMMVTMCSISIPLYILQRSNLVQFASAIFLILGMTSYVVSKKLALKIYAEKEF